MHLVIISVWLYAVFCTAVTEQCMPQQQLVLEAQNHQSLCVKASS